jgi:hypothetical protein
MLPGYPAWGAAMLPGYPAGEVAMLPRYPTDTVGEFQLGVDYPELGQDGACWGGESAVPDGPDQFANSIRWDTVGELPSEPAKPEPG